MRMMKAGAGANQETAAFLLILLVTVAAYLYLNLFALPDAPFLLSGDQMYFWVGAQRMFYGEHIYRDFLQFTPPGTDLVYLVFIKLFGLRIWLPNLIDLILGVGLCAVCFNIARQVMERWMAALATSLFLLLTYSSVLNGTHHWFSLLAIAGAVGIIMRGSSLTRVASAGALLGVASFFTQTHGAFAAMGLSVAFAWEGANGRNEGQKIFQRLSCLVLSFATVLVALSTYLLATVGWRRLWYFQVIYPAKYVAYGQLPLFFGLFPTWHNLPSVAQFLFVYTGLPVIYGLVLWRGRKGPVNEWRRLMMLCLVGLSLFVEVCFSANYLRIYAIAMPGLILLAWMVGRIGRYRSYVVGALVAGIVVLGVHQTYSRHHNKSSITELPAGRVVVRSESYEKLSWLMQHTHSGQLFFQATAPTLYLPLQLRNPAFLNEITENESTRPEDVQRAIDELGKKEVQYVLWSPYNDYADPRIPSAYHLTPLRDYLQTSYRRVHIFSDEDEIWQRK